MKALSKAYLYITEERWMAKLPLFVSFPRTGSEWVNAVMEVYFDRPRLRKLRITFLDTSRKDWMWFHDHDLLLSIRHSNVLYLVREPVETIYSNIEYTIATGHAHIVDTTYAHNALQVKEEHIIEFAKLYNQHIEKWTKGESKAKIVISYETFLKCPLLEMRNICKFFNKEFDETRVNETMNFVTKERMIMQNMEKSNGGLNYNMLDPSYNKNRVLFREKFSDLINMYCASY